VASACTWLLRLELYDSIARERLPRVDENSTLSPVAFDFALAAAAPPFRVLWISGALPGPEAPVEF